MQIVNGVEHGAQHFTTAIQVVQVSATEAPACRAVVSFESVTGVARTSFIQRRMIGFVACISDLQVSKAREQVSVSRVSGGHHAIEHVHTV